mmetsp:Transcript_9788/g.14436  ORF Transcript_9788/g.14436 Transcript_9788/m.14436 type:complete len:410 (-) Transcript_9788:50-1279(-)
MDNSIGMVDAEVPSSIITDKSDSPSSYSPPVPKEVKKTTKPKNPRKRQNKTMTIPKGDILTTKFKIRNPVNERNIDWMMGANNLSEQIDISKVQIVIKTRNDPDKPRLPEKLFSSHKYSLCIQISQEYYENLLKVSGYTPKSVDNYVRLVVAYDKSRKNVVKTNGEPIIEVPSLIGLDLKSSQLLYESKAKFNFTDVSYHHGKEHFVFKIIFVNANEKLFELYSAPFKVYSRKKKSQDEYDYPPNEYKVPQPALKKKSSTMPINRVRKRQLPETEMPTTDDLEDPTDFKKIKVDDETYLETPRISIPPSFNDVANALNDPEHLFIPPIVNTEHPFTQQRTAFQQNKQLIDLLDQLKQFRSTLPYLDQQDFNDFLTEQLDIKLKEDFSFEFNNDDELGSPEHQYQFSFFQ